MRKCQSLAAAVVAATMLTSLSPGFSTPIVRAEQDSDGLGACAPGVQLLGFSEALNKTTFGGFDLAELSALAYDPWNNVYYAVADRAGPIQSHFFTLDLPITGEGMGAPTVRAVTPLSDADGAPFTGANFDGEGAVLTSQGTLFISSEGGSTAGEQPEIHQFSVSGEYLGQLAVPPRFLVGVNNQSLESLALSPEGRSLFTANEGPLPSVESAPEDGLTDDLRNRVRILRYEDRELAGFVPADQFYYASEPNRAPGDLGVVELIALSETTLLVLERGFVPGEGNTVRLFRTSIEGARDVSGEPTLAAPGLEPLAKTLIFDLADCPGDGAILPEGATQPNPLVDNFEGISLGPRLPDGRRVLLLVSDDNFGANQTTRLVAVAVAEEVLTGSAEMDGGDVEAP